MCCLLFIRRLWLAAFRSPQERLGRYRLTWTIIEKCVILFGLFAGQTPGGDLKVIVEDSSPLIQRFLSRLDPGVTVRKVSVLGTKMFGPTRVGFQLIELDGDDPAGNKLVANSAFLRGDAVAMLVILSCVGKLYTALVRQFRLPVGRYVDEIPAGVLDADGKPSGQAIKELKEELGIEIDPNQLIDMCEATGIGSEHGIPPSAGGCDEHIRYFLYRTTVTPDELADMEGRATGVMEEGESIAVRIVPFRDICRKSPDGKTLTALTLYAQLCALEDDHMRLPR